MEYHEAVNRLERLRRKRPKLGTETTASLLAELGDPFEGVPAVQVAGSNGKGSTARLLEGILDEAGLDVGLYTSPDLNDLRERVRVGGRKIPKRAVTNFVEEVWPIIVEKSIEGDAPTFFEVYTAMALWHFGREAVDVAVLEVGIGGRYDATSVADPIAAAVTSVSLEHTDIIGSTVEEIAADTAQVAPADAPLVTGVRGDALETIRAETDVMTVGGGEDERASTDHRPGDEDGWPDIRANEGEMLSLTESTLVLDGPDWGVETEMPLLGQHQAVNAGIAATLARQVADVGEETLAAGIRNVAWPGRFEVMDDAPMVVLDGAHNPDACEKLASLLSRYDYDDLRLVFGAMHDKDYGRMCTALPPLDHVAVAEPAVNRAEDADVLETVFDRETDAATNQFDSVLDAVEHAVREADEDDCVVVTGSLYVVAEARDRWTRTPTPLETRSTRSARQALETANVPAADATAHAERLVQRTVRLHARREQAADLETAMHAVGGDCAVSGIGGAGRHVEVVLSGTLAQFRALVDRVKDREPAFEQLLEEVTETLEIDAVEATTEYPWGDGTAVMGILNVTPDSFHDGGEYIATADAVDQAMTMIENGGDIIDVGGESTRPGAEPVPVETEKARVVPVIEALDDKDAMVSVDTRRPAVAEAALEAGADMVNDVTGLEDIAMRRVVAEWDVPAVMMHSISAPVDPDHDVVYDDIVDDILESLGERMLLAERAGIDRSQLLVDPGLGFGKTAAESFELLDRLREFRGLGAGVMVGHSHKSMFAEVAGDDRFASTVAATALAAERGADVVRVHDVAGNADAVGTAQRTIGDE